MTVEPKRGPWGWGGRRVKLGVRNLSPFADTRAFWQAASQVALVAMSAILIVAFLHFARLLLLPVLSALVVSMALGPLTERAARRGIPAWLAATAIIAVLAAGIYLAIVSLSQPISELVSRSSEIGTAIKDKLQILDRPLAAIRELQSAVPGTSSNVVVNVSQETIFERAVSIITPAALEILLFFATLFFLLVGRATLRRSIGNLFSSREGRLRTLRIATDIERNLSTYLITVTVINFCVGLITIGATYLMGLPTPILWGALAFALNYLPYVGPGSMYVILFIIGLLTYPSLWSALIPPAFYMVLSFLEGQLVTPNIVGRRLLMQPLAVFLSLAFWAWLWGPIGAFLATPILIMATVAIKHLYPRDHDALSG